MQTPSSNPGALAPPPPTGPALAQASSRAAADSLSPELFTGIVQGVLSTMMSSLGAQQGNGESIAQFIQRLSQTSNLFTPGSGDAVGKSAYTNLIVMLAKTTKKTLLSQHFTIIVIEVVVNWLSS